MNNEQIQAHVFELLDAACKVEPRMPHFVTEQIAMGLVESCDPVVDDLLSLPGVFALCERWQEQKLSTQRPV